MSIPAGALALPTALLLTLTAGALVAAAGSQAPGRLAAAGQPVVTDLGGNAKASTSWSDRPDGWHVVTTVDTVAGSGSPAESHAVVRVTATLKPGQSQEISVPQPVGAAPQVLRVERRDGGLVVAVAAE